MLGVAKEDEPLAGVTSNLASIVSSTTVQVAQAYANSVEKLVVVYAVFLLSQAQTFRFGSPYGNAAEYMKLRFFDEGQEFPERQRKHAYSWLKSKLADG